MPLPNPPTKIFFPTHPPSGVGGIALIPLRIPPPLLRRGVSLFEPVFPLFQTVTKYLYAGAGFLCISYLVIVILSTLR